MDNKIVQFPRNIKLNLSSLYPINGLNVKNVKRSISGIILSVMNVNLNMVTIKTEMLTLAADEDSTKLKPIMAEPIIISANSVAATLLPYLNDVRYGFKDEIYFDYRVHHIVDMSKTTELPTTIVETKARCIGRINRSEITVLEFKDHVLYTDTANGTKSKYTIDASDEGFRHCLYQGNDLTLT